MPWCPSCAAFLSPPTVRADGSCPRCGEVVDRGRAQPAAEREARDEETQPIPWHLKLLAGAVAVYLGYRAWQGIEWLARRL